MITDPKTPKSNRTIVMPDFLAIEMEGFIKSLFGIKMNDRIFTISKSYLHHEMYRGAKLAGVKRIRIHGLRHSHISLLINLEFSALAIGESWTETAVATKRNEFEGTAFTTTVHCPTPRRITAVNHSINVFDD